MTARAARVGVAFLALYVIAAVATASWAPGRLRPLFDGFGTHPGEYNWVKPPKEFAEGNRTPDTAQARIALGGGGSTPALAQTPDGQVMVSLPQGAVPPRSSDTAATVEVRPVDPTTLGPLPAGLRPESNAYKVTITYVPSGTELPAVAVPASVGVTAEVRPTTFLFAPDGRSWRPIDGQPLSPANGFTGTLTEVGYYLAAGQGQPRPVGASGGGVPVALIAVAAAVPLVLGYLLLVRRRPPTVTPGARVPIPRPPPQPQPQPKAPRDAPARAGAKPKPKSKSKSKSKAPGKQAKKKRP